MSKHRWSGVVLAALAASWSGCDIATHYIPRTPGRVAMGVRRGEPTLLKDGAQVDVAGGAARLVACSAGALASAVTSAGHQASYRSNITIASVSYALSGFVPLLIPVGAYFGGRATQELHLARASLVDAVNQHNDDPACAGTTVAGRRP